MGVTDSNRIDKDSVTVLPPPEVNNYLILHPEFVECHPGHQSNGNGEGILINVKC